MKSIKTPENIAYMESQIKNSIEIIHRFWGNKKLSGTALQNALMSLILLPFERAKQQNGQRIWQGKYTDIKKEIGWNEIVFQPIQACKNGKIKFKNKSQYSFIRKFRNAIAHQNIQILVNLEKEISIEFFNIFPAQCKDCSNTESCKADCKAKKVKYNQGKIEDFRVSFTYLQLYNFSLYVADSYLKAITGIGLEPKYALSRTH